MKKLDLDLTIVGSVTLLAMLIWSNVGSNEQWSIGVLLLFGSILFGYNVFILLVRESETRLIFIVHVYVFYVLGVLVFGLMMLEETSLGDAVLYFLLHMLLPFFSYILIPKIEEGNVKKMKFSLFFFSIVVFIVSAMLIIPTLA